MPLFKSGHIVEDVWTSLDDNAVLPVGVPVIVSLSRLLSDDNDYLFHCGCRLGVRLGPEEDVDALESWLGRLDLVALYFPKFSDGRPYSHARILRERLGFRGEIRALGDVLCDQYSMLQQCGFDAFEPAEDTEILAWRDAAEAITLRYQSDVRFGDAVNVLSARQAKAASRQPV